MTCSEFDRLIDLYIDGELDNAQKNAVEAHAAACEECAGKLRAAEELKDILSHMDDDVSVPLQAQAAWRRAVREESKRRNMKNFYRAFGAVAAVCVLTFGVTAMLQQKPVEPQGVELVAADGVTESASFDGETAARSGVLPQLAEYTERTLAAEDVDQALAYLKDIAAEYGAVIENESESAQGVNVFLQVPAESAEDFISAVDAIAAEPDERTYAFDASAATVGVCVMIVGG